MRAYPYFMAKVRKSPEEVDALAKVTSKGQLTVPQAVREALGINPGDGVYFKVRGDTAELTRIPNFVEELGGSVSTPERLRGKSWKEIREEAWASARSRNRP
ncbi:MAG: AbrB/MazE/SpoVT family DNA-binding domain-containing protein [Actinobacteria bacterium]|nr:AbrB/MazE/SpoVT family DNA-binding domain-containing protein [Actinomycetota bacterium]